MTVSGHRSGLRWWLKAAWIVALSPGLLLPLTASGQSAESDEADRLIEQLSGPTYALREDASRRLVELGMAAWEPLQSAVVSTDPEVRYRARRALGVIEANELERLIQAFEQDTTGAAQIALPGWNEFQSMAGNSPEARALFVEMARAEPNLLRAVPGSREVLSDLLASRCLQIQIESQGNALNNTPPRAPSRGTAAMLMFVGGIPEVLVDEQVASQICNLASRLVQPPRTGTNNSQSQAAPQRRLLAHWIGRDWSTMPLGAYQALMLAMSHNLPEGLGVALTVLSAGGAQPHLKQFAAVAVGRFGSKQHVPRLLPLLEDETVCWNRNDQEPPTEIRDIALAVLVQMTGQDPKDYNLDGMPNNRTLFPNASSVRFRTKADREAALKRWHEWYQQHADRLAKGEEAS